MTQRLDRIEAIRKRTAQSAEANTTAIEANRVVIAQLPSTRNSLVQVVEIHQLNHQATQHNFKGIVSELREIRSEIRGLRTEIQPILEHLFFGREENGE